MSGEGGAIGQGLPLIVGKRPEISFMDISDYCVYVGQFVVHLQLPFFYYKKNIRMNFAKVNSEKANEIFLTARGCTGPTLPLVRHVLWDATQQCGLFLPLKKDVVYTPPRFIPLTCIRKLANLNFY